MLLFLQLKREEKGEITYLKTYFKETVLFKEIIPICEIHKGSGFGGEPVP